MTCCLWLLFFLLGVGGWRLGGAAHQSQGARQPGSQGTGHSWFLPESSANGLIASPKYRSLAWRTPTSELRLGRPFGDRMRHPTTFAQTKKEAMLTEGWRVKRVVGTRVVRTLDQHHHFSMLSPLVYPESRVA